MSISDQKVQDYEETSQPPAARCRDQPRASWSSQPHATPLHRRQHPHHHQQQVGGAAEREDDAPSLKYVDQPRKLSSEHFGGLYLPGLEEQLGGDDDLSPSRGLWKNHQKIIKNSFRFSYHLLPLLQKQCLSCDEDARVRPGL